MLQSADILADAVVNMSLKERRKKKKYLIIRSKIELIQNLLKIICLGDKINA